MFDYVTRVYPDPVIINHGDAVHQKPENAITDAGLGYEGQEPDALDDRFVFRSDGPWWDDMRVSVNQVKVQGQQNIPEWDAWLGNLQMLWFDPSTMEQVFFALQMPHGYLQGSNLHPHVHMVPASNASQATHRVRWGLEYTWQRIGDTFAAPTTIYAETNIVPDEALVANRHYLVEFTEITGISAADVGVSSMLMCRLFRDATNDDYTDDVGLLEVDFHYEILLPGSRSEYVQ